MNQSDETIKQDCENKGFVRLAAKIKKRFLELSIIITVDGLYVSHTVIDICKENGWNYIIRYKEGSASSIANKYRAMSEKEKCGSNTEYQNEVIFG